MNVQREVTPGHMRIHPDITKVTAEFDRLAKLIGSGAGGFRGFQTEERDALAAIIQEKKNEFMAASPTAPWAEYWTADGRVHEVFRSDSRARAIYDARQARRPGVPMPMRFIGFRDNVECRVFRFSTLPEDEMAEVCHVHVPLAYFGRNGLVLQEGPAFGVRLLEREQTPDYKATREDVDKFRSDLKPRVATKERRQPQVSCPE